VVCREANRVVSDLETGVIDINITVFKPAEGKKASIVSVSNKYDIRKKENLFVMLYHALSELGLMRAEINSIRSEIRDLKPEEEEEEEDL